MNKKRILLKLSSLLLFTSVFLSPLNACAETFYSKPSEKMKLVWSDEFDESEINKDNWTYDIGKGNNGSNNGWGNNELQYYTDRSDNSRIEDGNLVIEAHKENYNGSDYTSARLKSKELKEFTYGRIEARIKLPLDQGLWPAFWMLGSSFTGDDKWPYCGEIDIMEHVNKEPVVSGALHWDNNGPQTFGQSVTVDNLDDYHVYALEWTKNYIKWYVDDQLFCAADISDIIIPNLERNIKNNDAFHQPFFILLNMAVGGNWPKDPDDSTDFPAKMYVDYVRVYELS
ncbi:glycoside hydrolase family 16 protein [Clostridium butyricum]|uniref:glycoside hydrolase family 16 protein n=1 Tax=Clostridium butyricum TaxID=1492 RepID=UPI0002C8B483|nr:glycoside hydrolase family 16 protein [Clostridium butyricum]EMU55810.1 beta-glucanase (Endo-beta-1,3-1,4 glucanase) [Clostridium butyricum DKU-01]